MCYRRELPLIRPTEGRIGYADRLEKAVGPRARSRRFQDDTVAFLPNIDRIRPQMNASGQVNGLMFAFVYNDCHFHVREYRP